MSSKGLLIGSVLLAMLAGGVYWSEKREKAKEGQPAPDAPPKLIATPDDQIAKIEIRKRDAAPVVVQRGKDKKWSITAPEPLAADQDAVNSLASALSGLTWDRLVEEKTSQLGDFGLATPSAEVALTAADGKTRKVLLGDDNPSGSATFAKLEGDPRVFTLTSGTKSSLDKTHKDLRDKRLLTFDSDKLTRVELTAKGQTLEFGKNSQNEWQIVRPRPLRADSFQVEELVRKLKDASMDTTISDEDAKKAAAQFYSGSPMGTVKMTDASGTQTLELRKVKEDYYARSSVVQGVHKAGKDAGEAVNKGLDDFRNKKLFDFGFDELSKFEIRDGDKPHAFQKDAAEWKMNGKKVDAANVQKLIDSLRDLTSVKFAEFGFTTPAIEITATSNNGKRVEKVQISKTGDKYFARRENEPSVYELDTAIVEAIRKSTLEMK